MYKVYVVQETDWDVGEKHQAKSKKKKKKDGNKVDGPDFEGA